MSRDPFAICVFSVRTVLLLSSLKIKLSQKLFAIFQFNFINHFSAIWKRVKIFSFKNPLILRIILSGGKKVIIGEDDMVGRWDSFPLFSLILHSQSSSSQNFGTKSEDCYLYFSKNIYIFINAAKRTASWPELTKFDTIFGTAVSVISAS